MPRLIRIIIADDHPMVVDGLVGYFKGYPDIEVIATTSKLQEILKLILVNKPDILIMDYHFANEELNGLDVCKKIYTNYPCTKVIIVSSFCEVGLIQRFIEAGASGYLLKTATKNEYIDAVMNVFAGGESFGKDVRDLIVKERLSENKQQQIKFTKTEKEILRFIINGDSSETIAKKMYRERSTIDSHRKSILSNFQLMDSGNSNLSKNISHYIAKFNIAQKLDCL